MGEKIWLHNYNFKVKFPLFEGVFTNPINSLDTLMYSHNVKNGMMGSTHWLLECYIFLMCIFLNNAVEFSWDKKASSKRNYY